MKHTAKRLLALLLALSMALSLLSVSVWAAEEPDGSVPVMESQEEAPEAEPEESEAEPEPEESEPEPEESEADPEESAPEADPEESEADPEEAAPEADPEESEADPEESAPAPAEAEAEPEEGEEELEPQWDAVAKVLDANEQEVTVQLVTNDLQSYIGWAINNGGNYTVQLQQNVNTTKTINIAAPTTENAGDENTLTLDLNGHSITYTGTNYGPVIEVPNGQSLTLEGAGSNSIITHAEGTKGPGVEVNGTLVMNGGTITGNQSYYGGGVYVKGGSFTMNGGTITNNEAIVMQDSAGYSGNGGGVYVKGGSFTMNDGTISDNTAQYGGGVCVDSGGEFTMNDGSIEDNAAAMYGGGVCVDSGGEFTMNDGEITGNKTDFDGGGVFAGPGCQFIMADGLIAQNSSMTGGGVTIYVMGKFFLAGGTIEENEAMFGGGVANIGRFYMGGTIDTGSGPTSNPIEIKNNTAAYGGGVVTADASGCVFSLSRGSITHNKADMPSFLSNQEETNDNCYGGGVLVATGDTIYNILEPNQTSYGDEHGFVIGGVPVISDNTGSMGSDNVALEVNVQPEAVETVSCAIKVMAPLTNDTPIGVNLLQMVQPREMSVANVEIDIPTYERTSGVFTSGLSGNGDASNFVSDSEDYAVTLTEQGEAQLLPVIKGVSAEDVSADYDGKEHSIEVKGVPEGATVTYTKSKDEAYTATNPAYTDAGSYTTLFRVECEGHAPFEGSAKVTIAPKKVTATPDDKSSVYNEDLKELTYQVTGLVKDADKDSLKLTASTEATKTSKAGKYPITLKQGEKANENYKVELKEGTYTITKAQQKQPEAPKVKQVTENSLTVETVAGQEYSIDGGKTWQTSGTFKNLVPGRNYQVITRVPGNENYEASPVSKATKTTTKENRDSHLGVKVRQTGSSLTVSWSKRSDVDTFEIHADYCGKHFGDIPTVTVKTKKSKKTSYTITKLGGKALKTNKNFRVQVVGKKNGKEVCKSEICHIVGVKNRKRTNAKDITNLPAKTVTLKLNNNKKKARKLKPKTVKQFPKRKQLGKNHTSEFRFASSNENVATVNEKGKVTAVGKGKCIIYVIARNGLEKTVNVKVK